jgi:hypothetical protein
MHTIGDRAQQLVAGKVAGAKRSMSSSTSAPLATPFLA